MFTLPCHRPELNPEERLERRPKRSWSERRLAMRSGDMSCGDPRDAAPPSAMIARFLADIARKGCMARRRFLEGKA